MSSRLVLVMVVGAATMVALHAGGCGSAAGRIVVQNIYVGEHGKARAELTELVRDKYGDDTRAAAAAPSRDFVLDHMRLGAAMLSDGYTPELDSPWDLVYAVLRQQSLNKNYEIPAFLLTEELAKIWKGEPFEQALAYHYIGLHYGMQGSWDNARTAAIGSQFQLRALTTDGTKSPAEALKATAETSEEDLFGSLQDVQTDFALGYLLQGVACHSLARERGDMNRMGEAESAFSRALAINPGLSDLVSTLKAGRYNTLIVADFGRGPKKVRTGPNGAIADWNIMQASDTFGLDVVLGGSTTTFPQVCDVNVMAVNHVWNDLEDMRKAKSLVGNALIVGGAATVAVTSQSSSSDTQGIGAIVGLSTMIVGALMASSAAADVRYCEAIPQRIYLAPIAISTPATTVTIAVAGHPEGRLTLELDPPRGTGIQLCYVRLPSGNGENLQLTAPPAWATTGQTLYSNDFSPRAGQQRLPYILGGDCVRRPSEEALASYQKAGFLKDVTVSQLESWYRAEGIGWDEGTMQGVGGRHVLEGGNTLIPPRPGTAGWARLFGQRHAPYEPKSAEVKAAVATYGVGEQATK